MTTTVLPAASGSREISIQLARPSLPSWAVIQEDLEEIWRSGVLTLGPHTERLEAKAADLIGVPHVVAVSSATSGLLLVLRALDLEGEVVLPSFTFGATGHAVLWNGLIPRFCDIEPRSWTLDPLSVRRCIGPETAAVLGVNVFGLPCDAPSLEKIAGPSRLPLVVDSAQGLTGERAGRKAGASGDAEIFSLSPSKLATACEGGLVATRDASLAAEVRLLRDYGKRPGTCVMEALGLNARMSEIHAAIGCATVERAPEERDHRESLCRAYRERLADCAVTWQSCDEEHRSARNYFVILVGDGQDEGPRERLAAALRAEGIETKPYFHPPLHEQPLYRGCPRDGSLPVTNRISRSALALPLHRGLGLQEIERICRVIRAHLHQSSSVSSPGEHGP